MPKTGGVRGLHISLLSSAVCPVHRRKQAELVTSKASARDFRIGTSFRLKQCPLHDWRSFAI